jgi:phosphoesterase RecJ-like protein
MSPVNEFKKRVGQAAKTLKAAKKVMVVAHVHPDGDTLGCLLALGLALIHLGKRVFFLCADAVPTRLQFLPGSELVTSQCREKADVAVAVDCGSPRQLGALAEPFFKTKNNIQIDHHDFGEAFGKIQVLEPEASAVGEIVYELIRALDVEITPAIATCLLTSIIVDTGAFRFSNVRARTFEICAHLAQKGVDVQHLIEESYWVKNRPMAFLSSHAVLNAHFSKEGSVAWATVSQADIRRYGAGLSDADSVADDLRYIEGVKVAALFRETDKGHYRVSLRSKKGINVALVAKRFDGGGHHSSAGCCIGRAPAEKKRLLAALEELVG